MTEANFSLTTWPIIFLISTSVGFFLSFVLVMKRKSNPGNVFLALLVLLFSISIADSVLYWTDYYLIQPDLLGLSLSFAFFFGPLFYSYVQASLLDKDVKWNERALHAIPGLLYLLYLSRFHLTFGEAKLLAIEAWYQDPINTILAPALKVISLGVYAWLTHKLLGLSAKQSPLWLKRASRLFMAYTFLLIIYNVLVVTGVLKIQWDYLIAAAMVVFIYYIGYLGFSNSKLMEGLKPSDKYKSTTLTSRAGEHIYEKLRACLENEKPWLNPELRLNNLAEQLGVTSHQLSQVINERGKMNFAEFVNSYRIEEAKGLILQGEKVIDVAFAVGFNNKTSFYEAFRKATDQTPNEFRKQHQLRVSHRAS